MLHLARLSTLPPVDKLLKSAVADAALSRELDWMALRHPFQSQPLRDSAKVVDHLFFPIIWRICIFSSFLLSSEGKLLLKLFQRKIYSEKQAIEKSHLLFDF